MNRLINTYKKRLFIAPLSVLLLLANSAPLNGKIKEEKESPIQTKTDFDKIIFDWTRTFAEVLQTTKQKHYKISDLEECMTKAIDSFLNSLDPHSGFLGPKAYKIILETTSGEFFGIGIVIDNTRNPKDKVLMVIDTIPGGPADKVGLKPTDKIIEIDGKPLEGMSTEEASAKLKGERNSIVNIKVIREENNDLLSFSIKRDVIKEYNSLCFYLDDHDIYYLSLNMFTQNAVKQIEELLKKSNKKKCKGLILDLRNNSGGLLNAAIDIAGLFLDKNSLIAVTKDKDNKEFEQYLTTREPVISNGMPIIILINNYTASAAEILAGCLKIYSEELSQKAHNQYQKKHMIFLLGTKTFGKGSVQEIIPVGNNCAMKLTTSLYFLSHDTSIQGIGITPDFVVERTFGPPKQIEWLKKFYGHEQAYSNYIKTDNNQNHKQENDKKEDGKKKKKEKSWMQRSKEILASDNQFREAITILNMLDTAQALSHHEVKTRQKAIAFIKRNHLTDEKITMTDIKV